MEHTVNIAMVGTGYVGLVSGACFAEHGFKVICVDKDRHKIERLNQGRSVIHEPLLAQMIRHNQASGRLIFSTQVSDVISQSDIIFITVGTPMKPDGQADITAVENIVNVCIETLTQYRLIVIKSTVPVGTCRRLQDLVRSQSRSIPCDIVFNPEFLSAGTGIHNFIKPDRVIIGTESEHAYIFMRDLYQSFLDHTIPIVKTNLENAELIKYASNGFLAMKLAFVNELANLCEPLGAEVDDVLYGMGLDKRIGTEYLQPGPGFGGSCLLKDGTMLSHMGQAFKMPVRMMEAALTSNQQHQKKIIEKIMIACGGSVLNKRLSILGIAFKSNTDDVRESPALYIMTFLIDQGAQLRVYDPVIKTLTLDTHVEWGEDVYDTIQGTDAVILTTDWDEFRNIDLNKTRGLLRNTILIPTWIDLRNMYQPYQMEQAGFLYYSMGRRPVMRDSNEVQITEDLNA